MHNEDSPRVDASHLLQKIGIMDPDKTRFVMDMLGFDAAEDLYCTDVEAWTNLNMTYNSNLKPKQGYQPTGRTMHVVRDFQRIRKE